MNASNNLALVSFLCALAFLTAAAPQALAWHEHCGGSVTSGGDIYVWVPDVHHARCLGVWVEQDPSANCPVGVDEIKRPPFYLRGGKGSGCAVGVAILIP